MILFIFLISFCVEIWLKMTNFDSVSVQKYPFRVNVQVKDLIFQFTHNIDQLIEKIIELIKLELNILGGTLKRRAMGFFIDYKVVSVVFKDFKDFRGEILR